MQRDPWCALGDGATRRTSADDVAVEAALEVRLNGQPFSVIDADARRRSRVWPPAFCSPKGSSTAADDVDCLAVPRNPSGEVVDVILTEERAAAVAAQRDARRQ